MKEKLFSLALFILELITYVIILAVFEMPLYIGLKIGIIWFIMLSAFGHYKIKSNLIWNEIKMLLKVFMFTSVMTFIIYYPFVSESIIMVIIYFLMTIISLFIDRTLRIVLRDKMARKTLIIGTGSDAYRLGRIAHNNRFALTNVKGYVKVPGEEIVDDIITNEHYRLYEFDNLYEKIDVHNIEQVIISLTSSNKDMLDSISRKLHGKVKYIKIAPKLDFTMTFDSRIDDFDGILLVSTARGTMKGIGLFLKRCLDICAGLAGCILLVPLTFYVKHKNKKSGDNESVFFTQERIGLNGKPIKIYKYRSMIPNAEAVLEELMEKDSAIKEEYLTNKKLANDPRVTEVGHFLRRTSLDEFPQFINVLKGEMSFVGPRPYLFREIEDMDIYYDSIIKCKPGITGMWQANGRSDVGFIDRCKLDDYYYKNWNFSLDLIIIYKTVKGVIYGKGAL